MDHCQHTVPPPATRDVSCRVHRDVRLKRLPFFDFIAEVIQPLRLVSHGKERSREGSFVFQLTPQQVLVIINSRQQGLRTHPKYAIQLQMRFCLQDTSCEQDDFFPPGICVKVNDKVCPLPCSISSNTPGVEPKPLPGPIDITPLVKLNSIESNRITISWNADCGCCYAVVLHLVLKLTISEALKRLKRSSVEFTKGLIKAHLAEAVDRGERSTYLIASTICPIRQSRMIAPCRASTCDHLQCFDAASYLELNEKKPTWRCPVCDRPALFENLVIDEYLRQVLLSNELSVDVSEIEFHQDGSCWASSLIVYREAVLVYPPVEQEESPVAVSGEVECVAEFFR